MKGHLPALLSSVFASMFVSGRSVVLLDGFRRKRPRFLGGMRDRRRF
jgi:hypothetical protein